jgi:lactoylglutathione lyase
VLHTAYRVTDLERSLGFYARLGFQEVGRVVSADGSTLLMLKLPDDAAVTLELVFRAAAGAASPGDFSHIVVQVPDLNAALSRLSRVGIACEPPQLPGGPAGPKTSFLTDPDGYRIELVQWPPDHADGLTAADFA